MDQSYLLMYGRQMSTLECCTKKKVDRVYGLYMYHAI